MMNKQGSSLVSLVEVLRARRGEIVDSLLSGYREEIPQYAEGNVPSGDLFATNHDQFLILLDVMETGRALTGEERRLARETGAHRAQQGHPLDALMRAYQLAGGVVWRWLLLEAEKLGTTSPNDLYSAAGVVFRFITEMSGEAAAGYREWLAEADLLQERRRVAAVVALLQGNVSDPSLAHPGALGPGVSLESFFVAGVLSEGQGAHTTSSVSMRHAETSLSRFRQQQFRADPLVAATGDRLSVVIPVPTEVDAERLQAWSEPGFTLCIGSVVRGSKEVARSYEEACAVQRVVRPSTWGVVGHRSVLADIVVTSDPVAAHELTASILGPLVESSSSDLLIATLRAYFECGYDVGRAARSLNVHRNTVAYRIRQIEGILNRRLDDYDNTTLPLHIALRWLSIHGGPARRS